MTEHQLEVILKMRDEASKKLEQFSQKVENEMGKAAEALKSFGKALSKIGTDMTMIGASITAPLALAFKTTADNSLEAHEAMKRLQDSARELQVTIGTALTPVVEKVSYLFAGLTQWFQNLDPKLRNTTLQFILITGVCLTLGGALTHIVGKVADLAGRLLEFAKIHPYILLAVIALTAFIVTWDKVRQYVLPIINAIEAGLSGMGWVVLQIEAIFEAVFEGIVRTLTRVFDLLSKIPGPQKEFFKTLRDGAKNVADDFKTTGVVIQEMALNLEKNMTNIYEGGMGKLSAYAETGLDKLAELYDFVKNPPKVDIDTSSIDAESVVVSEQKKVDQLRTVWAAWYSEKTMMNMAQLQAETEFYNVAIDAQVKAHQSMWTMVGQAKDVFAQSVSKLFVDMAKGVADVKKFWQDLGWKMLEILIDFGVQKLVNFAVSQAMLAAEVAASSGAAATIAAMWAPAAAMVSLATLGGNAGPASAALAGVTALATMLSIPKFAEGGIVDRPTIALIGERGPEAVVPLGRSSGSINNINISVNNPSIRSDSDIDTLTEEISRRLAHEIERI